MSIQGLRTTENWAADQRPLNWRDGLLRLNPNGMAPLFAMTALMKSKSTDDAEFNWWEKAMQTRRFALGADLTSSNTTVTLAAGSTGTTLKEGDLLLVEQTLEVVMVATDPVSDLSIEVVRGYSGTSATAVDYDGSAINPNMIKIGSAYEEGSLAPTGISFDPTKRYNYTQIFRDTFEATRTASKTRLRTGDDVKEAKRECLELHSAGIERALFLGRRHETTKNGKPLRTTGGLYQFIDSANIATAGGTTDMEDLETYLYNIFRYGSNEKIGFCGNKALLVINQIVRKNASLQIFSGIKEYGMKVTRLDSNFGSLVLKTHPLFNQQPGGTNAGSNAYIGPESWLWVLDASNVTWRYFTGDDTRYQPDLQENGMDGMKSGFLTEGGLEVHLPETHYLIKGLTAAAVDGA